MYESFQRFWPDYLAEHRKPATRQLHFAGTVSALTLLACGHWLFAVLIAYGLAWIAHFFVEGNAPATFRNPLLSLIGDFYMCWLLLTGRLDQEAALAEKRAELVEGPEPPAPGERL